MSAINKTARFLKFGIFALQAAAVVIALYQTYKKTLENGPKFKESKLKPKFAKGERDLIDETSWESFPASDAPASNKFT